MNRLQAQKALMAGEKIRLCSWPIGEYIYRDKCGICRDQERTPFSPQALYSPNPYKWEIHKETYTRCQAQEAYMLGQRVKHISWECGYVWRDASGTMLDEKHNPVDAPALALFGSIIAYADGWEI